MFEKTKLYANAALRLPFNGEKAFAKAVMSNQSHNNKKRDALLEKGGFERLTPDHPNSKMALIAKSFEELWAKPLCKKFRRNRLGLYLDKPPVSDAKGLDAAMEKALRERRESPFMVGLNIISIPEVFARNLSVEEISWSLAHEIGHHLQLDDHPRKKLGNSDRHRYQSEKLADKIAVFLMDGNVEIGIKKLDKIIEHQRNAIPEFAKAILESPPSYNPLVIVQKYAAKIVLEEDKKHKENEPESKASATHPSPSERKQDMRRWAEQMQTSEGHANLEQEIEEELRAIHRQLFAHQFDRSTANIRA